MSEEQIKAAQKELGEPVFIGFTDELNKIRRNLVILSFIAIAYKLSGAHISSFEPLGIHFDEHLSARFVDTAFFLFVLYNFIHFFWLSLDTLYEWRIRLTGTRLAYVTTGRMAGQYADYPNDPRQSSLMTWWKEDAPRISGFDRIFTNLEKALKELDDCAHAKDLGELPNISNIFKTTGPLTTEIATLKRKIEETGKIITSERIPASLERFEKWYRMFSYSQLARWMTLEWGLPIISSIAALCLLFPWEIKL